MVKLNRFKIESFILDKDIHEMTSEELVMHVIDFIRNEINKYGIEKLYFEDFEQDCILNILKYFKKIDKNKYPKSYINSIVNSSILNNIKRYYKHIKKEKLSGDIMYFEDKFPIIYSDKSYLSVLNEKEIEIFNLIFAGYTYKEIADKYNVSKARITQITDVMASKIKKYREEN